MSVCVFFGHRDCCGLDEEKLQGAIEDLIGKGIDMFYVGNQGNFDAMVYGCLKRIRKVYPHIRVSVVLAYLPTGIRGEEAMPDAMYPEGMELGPQKFAIERRNKWLVDKADYVICYVRYSWGGAYKFAKLAKRRGKAIINLGDEALI